MMKTIAHIAAREILDSRGFPSVEVDVYVSDGSQGRFSVPSGASTGSHEALELRDKDNSRFLGKGVLKALAHIREEIAPVLVGVDISQQRAIDEKLIALDGTPNKSKLGANAILGVSVACAKANAAAQKVPFFMSLGEEEPHVLPVPMMNVLNGGAHADNGLDVQEFMLVPIGAPSFREAIRYGAEIFQHLRQLLNGRGLSTAVGDEGGFAPHLRSNEEALELLCIATQKAGYALGKDIYFAVDAAATEWFDSEKGHYHTKELGNCDAGRLIDMWSSWCENYPIYSLEDALDENDWDSWRDLTQKLGHHIQLVGDDLFVTNPLFLKRGIKEKVANAILIKLNQIGTLTESLDVVAMAKKAGYGTVISHRSGETEDTSIADIAVGTSAMQIKTGSLCRSDRLAKYNQLLRIEELLGSKAHYAGRSILGEK